MLLIPDTSKRNISRSINQEERKKVVMVSSSDKEAAQTGPVIDTGLGLYNPPGPQGSGINHETPHKIAFAPALFMFEHVMSESLHQCLSVFKIAVVA